MLGMTTAEFYFAGLVFSPRRAELRRPDGETIKLRPKTSDMLLLFAENAGRVLSKDELTNAVWPDVYVSEDNLFQRIREIRTALGDDERQLVKLVSGRGYMLMAEVSATPPTAAAPAAPARVEAAAQAAAATPHPDANSAIAPPRSRPMLLMVAPLAVLAVAITSIAAWTFLHEPFQPRKLAIAVAPINVGDIDVAGVAAAVTDRLADGLAKIDDLRVIRIGMPETVTTAAAGVQQDQADYKLSGDLDRSDGSWKLHARLIKRGSAEEIWSDTVEVAIGKTDISLQQSRLAAGVGHRLARYINERTWTAAPAASEAAGQARVVVQQATALLNHTNKERFAAAQAMLEKAQARDPDNVDVGVALAELQLRGIQMVWYTPEQSAAAQVSARATLEKAVRLRPGFIAALQGYCRFLTATNDFTDSLVACARTLSFDPWNGLVLYHIGLAQLQLGRFEEALATFEQADRFDTPQVSRWTWLLGAGMTLMLMDRSDDALPWLQRSLAITPASGRTYMLLAACYWRLGREADAKAAMAKGIALRPGSNLENVIMPTKNASPIFLTAAGWIERSFVQAGLPER